MSLPIASLKLLLIDDKNRETTPESSGEKMKTHNEQQHTTVVISIWTKIACFQQTHNVHFSAANRIYEACFNMKCISDIITYYNLLCSTYTS